MAGFEEMRVARAKALAILHVVVIAMLSGLITTGVARAVSIVPPLEPRLSIEKGVSIPQVSLTLDLCMGKTDYRIFDTLIEQQIPATLFVTARWLARNSAVVAKIRAHPELFEIGNHGRDHIPAIDTQKTIYGLKTAGSLKRICEEIEGGAQAIKAAGLDQQFKPFYRTAAARYSPDAILLIERLGYQIGGFSLNADMGASLPAKMVSQRISAAKDGDVIIAHMNQPQRGSGTGVAAGIIALKKKGMHFIKLSDGVRAGGRLGDISAEPCASVFAR